MFRHVNETLGASPVPASEWPVLERVLGVDLLARLLSDKADARSSVCTSSFNGCCIAVVPTTHPNISSTDSRSPSTAVDATVSPPDRTRSLL